MTEEEVEEILESDDITVLTQDLSVSSWTTCCSVCIVINFLLWRGREGDQGQNVECCGVKANLHLLGRA